MNLAKSKRRSCDSIEGPSTTLPTETTVPSLVNESFELPAPLELSENSDSSSEDDEYAGEADQSDYDSLFGDWISEMGRIDLQRVAMMLYNDYQTNFGLMKTGAARKVASFLKISEKTVRSWRKEFLMDPDGYGEEHRGKHLRYQLINDEQYRDQALEWVRNNNNVTGQKNMTASDFCSWLNSTLLPEVRRYHPHLPETITVRTAVRWLRLLGFEPMSSKKGLFFDGHERSDVVEYRKQYLRRLEIISLSHSPPPLCDDEIPDGVFGPQRKNCVLLFHDECIYHSNDDQNWMWGEKGKQPIKPKGAGRGIMVSDFVDEHNGLLALTDAEFQAGKEKFPDLKRKARVLLKYGIENEGYWNSNKFIAQVLDVIKIVKIKYPVECYDVFWLFDQSSGHTAFAEDALNANKMNVKPGGAQPKMRDTTWGGRVQKMVLRDGTPKGMKQILIERGVNVTKMKGDEMRSVLQNMHDFKYEKTRVERLLMDNGFRGYFIPKFHCELNPIERVWAESKRYTREHCDYTFPGLECTIEPSLDSISVDLIRKYFRKMREYLACYRSGVTIGPDMQKVLKEYKSHRKVHSMES